MCPGAGGRWGQEAGGATTHVVDDLELQRGGIQVIQLTCTRVTVL